MRGAKERERERGAKRTRTDRVKVFKSPTAYRRALTSATNASVSPTFLIA